MQVVKIKPEGELFALVDRRGYALAFARDRGTAETIAWGATLVVSQANLEADDCREPNRAVALAWHVNVHAVDVAREVLTDQAALLRDNPSNHAKLKRRALMSAAVRLRQVYDRRREQRGGRE